MTVNPRTAYYREYKRQLRAKAKAAGKCGECARGSPRPTLLTCDACIQARIDRRDRTAS